MDRKEKVVWGTVLVLCASMSSFVNPLSLPALSTTKPRHLKQSSTPSPESLLGTPQPAPSATTKENSGVSVYRYFNPRSGLTCILMKTDALVEIKFKLHDLEEQADSFIPDNALIDGNCRNEDQQEMRISWTGYSLLLLFEKTTGGEGWYIRRVELSVSVDVHQLHGIQTRGKTIKLYHKNTLIPTPVGKSFSCKELVIPLETDEEDNPPPDLYGSLLLRLVQIQPFMYKKEDFGPEYQCQRIFRDETAPIAVGSTLALVTVGIIVGYAVYRYFRVKNVQYNTME